MPTSVGTTPIGLSKPNMTTIKSVLPAALIKPTKVVKKKFMMAPPDEKQSGMYNLKPSVDDEVVESL